MIRDAMEWETAAEEEMATMDDPYLCVGVCQFDPDSGYCLGCGRPPLPISDALPSDDSR